jgi:hypothetical protein
MLTFIKSESLSESISNYYGNSSGKIVGHFVYHKLFKREYALLTLLKITNVVVGIYPD